MASSQKQFTTDPKDSKVTEEKAVAIDVMNIVLEYCNFNKVNGHAEVPLVSTLFNSIKSARLKKLLTAIVNGQLDKVTAILERDPTLLVEKLEEKDYVVALSGQRSNNGTAYRTALAVEDTQMAAMIKAKLIEVAGEDVADAQYHEQFPKGWKADEAKRWAPLFTQLNTLTDVIKDRKQGDITSSGEPTYKLRVRKGSAVAVALAQFGSLLNAILRDIVRTGKHFNPQLLLEAFKIYNYHYEDFGNDWSDSRAMLFWQHVIGTIQRGLPVNYVQAIFDDLYTTEEKLRNNEPQGRSLIIELFDTGPLPWGSSNFYPLSVSRLGFDYRVAGLTRARGDRAASEAWCSLFEPYVNKKQHACRHLHPSSKTLEDSHRLA